MSKKAIQINEIDNVATVTSNISKGEIIEVLSPNADIIMTIKALDIIPFGHKVILTEIDIEENIIKYGEKIGLSSKPIKKGAWVHTQNIKSAIVPESYSGEEIN